MAKSLYSWTIDDPTESAAALKEFSSYMLSKVTQEAVVTGLTPVLTEAKVRAPKKTGALRNSLGIRVRKYKSGKSIVGLLGARTGVWGPNGEKPSKYSHLVEQGFISVAKGGEYVPGQPFLGPAFEAKRNDALTGVAEVLRKRVREKAERVRRKSRSRKKS